MTDKRPRRGLKEQVTAPLVIAAVLAVITFVGTFITATGGTNNEPNILLALTFAGGVFVATLVVCATLILVEKPNSAELGQGTGINRSSSKLYAEAKARRDAEARKKKAEEARVKSASAESAQTKSPQIPAEDSKKSES